MIVHAFPSARHATMVGMISTLMFEAGDLDAAEEQLLSHLEICWDRLEEFGVDCDEIEAECRLFARAAWRRYQQLQREAGVA